MASPVLPVAFQSAVPSATDSVCAAHVKFFSLPGLFYQYLSWKHDADGTLSEDYLSGLAVTEVPGVPEIPDPETGELEVPTGVFATTNRASDVTVSWASVVGATSYSVYRGVEESDYVRIANGVTGTVYVDMSGEVGRTYQYAVKAHSATKTSPGYSEPATGLRKAEPSEPIVVTYSLSGKSFLVPAGKTQLEVQLWGGGGRGGYFAASSYVGSGPLPGGGGASGAFIRVTGIPVEADEVILVKPGRETFVAGDATRPATTKTGDSFVFRGSASSSEFVKAFGGLAGRDNSGDNDTAGGAAAASYGSTSMGGTVQTGDCSVGNAGEASDNSTDGTGGAAVSYDGRSAGAGGNGTAKTKTGDIRFGAPGLAVLIFT